MNEFDQILKNRFVELPSKLQDTLSNPLWRSTLDQKAKSFGLNDEQISLLENEVVYVLLALEPKENLVENLKKEVPMQEDDARKINDYVNGAIFSAVAQEIKNLWAESGEEGSVAPAPKPRVRIAPVDFEEAILNQAKAMRPAEPANGGIMNHESRIMGEGKVPDNLPINGQATKIHEYKPGNDPYREPLE